MGEVWKPRDKRLGREVAIKVLPAESRPTRGGSSMGEGIVAIETGTQSSFSPTPATTTSRGHLTETRSGS
jgi:hypothetical protein